MALLFYIPLTFLIVACISHVIFGIMWFKSVSKLLALLPEAAKDGSLYFNHKMFKAIRLAATVDIDLEKRMRLLMKLGLVNMLGFAIFGMMTLFAGSLIYGNT